MKLELSRSDFLKAWQVVEKYTPSKTTIDALYCIRLTASGTDSLTLEATDLKSSVRFTAKGANVIDPGVVVIEAALFGNMLRKLDAQTVTLDIIGEKGTLKAGRSTLRFTVVSAESFPNIPESSGAEEICALPAQDLSRLITEGSCAASQPTDFPKYMGTCMLKTDEGNLMAISTDGKRLARSQKHCDSVSKNEELVLPAAALKDLAKTFSGENTVKILADGSTVWFSIDNAEFSIRRIEASFPKYEKIINDEKQSSVNISKDALFSALSRIDLIAKFTPSHIMSLSLDPDKKEIRIAARAQEHGTTTEFLDADVQGNFMQIGFNNQYLLDGLKAVNAESIAIEFSSDEGQTRIYNENGREFLYMLMPIRLMPQDLVNDEYPEEDTPSQPEPEEQNEQPQDYSDSQPEENNSDDAPF